MTVVLFLGFCVFVKLTIVISFTVSDGDQNVLLLTYQPEGKRIFYVLCFRVNFSEISRAVPSLIF